MWWRPVLQRQERFTIPDQIVRDELCPDVELRVAVVGGQVFHERREALVEPQVGPPFLENNKNNYRNRMASNTPWMCFLSAMHF